MTTSNPSSSNEKIIFKCDQHAASISEKLQKFYEEKDFFDTVIIADDNCTKIPAHKIVLSALSDYFWEIFHGVPSTSSVHEVKLEKVDGSSLKLIIDFIYSGWIELSLEKIETLLRSAVFFKIKNLIDGCCEYLVKYLNNNNCFYWLRLAKELRLYRLQEKSSNLIYTNLEKVTTQSEFLVLNKIELKDLLFYDNSHKGLEEQVFLGLVKWIEYEKQNRQHLLFELLSMVRYHYLTPKFIVENSTLVSKTVENCELILGWLKYHLSPESRTIEQQNFTLNYEAEPNKKEELQEEVSKVTGIHLNGKEVEIQSYNQTLKSWSIEKRTRPLSINKESHSPMIVIDKKLFIVGGSTNDGSRTISNSVECIDLKTFKLTDLPPMRIPRYQSQLANLNGHLCVFGGFDKTDCKNFIDSVEIFNFSTDKWSDLQPLFKPDLRNKIVGHNGILYIFDFRYGCVQCYDPSSYEWTLKEQPIDDRVKNFHTAVIGNYVYAICPGNNDYSRGCDYKKTVVKRFDLSNFTWCEIAEWTLNHSSITKVTAIGNKILLQRFGSSLIEYYPDTNKFTDLPGSFQNDQWTLLFKL